MDKKTWIVVGILGVVVLFIVMSQKQTAAITSSGTTLTGAGGVIAGLGGLASGLGKGIASVLGANSADSPGAGGYTPAITMGTDSAASSDVPEGA